MSRYILPLAFIALLGGCVGKPALTPRPGLTVQQMSDLPAPNGNDVASATRVYLISPFDRLNVTVYGVEEMQKQNLRVDSGGLIQVPLAGSINAAGMTLEELSSVISQRLSRYILEPDVSVNLDETTTQSVTVYGAVREPGQFAVNGKMTLLRAIALANGLDPIANSQQVVVFRTVGNQDMAALYDLAAIESGAYADPEIYSNDVISVDEDRRKQLFGDILAASPLLVTPVIVLLQQL